MGLFDGIRCEYPLPDACPNTEFQTKSLACTMDTYCLTASGRLLTANGADTGLHGVLRMYTSDASDHWWEYEAKFTDGQLMRLVAKVQAQYGEDGLLLGCSAV